MARQRRIGFAASAIEDLEAIRAWYAEQQAAEIGERLLREVILPPFRIVYRLDDQRVRVVRIWRSERLLTLP